MHRSGKDEVAQAQADGRWQAAYAGQASAEVPEDLANAVTLNSVALNLARVFGAALGGALAAALGLALCFAFNAVSFLAVLAGLFGVAFGERDAREGVVGDRRGVKRRFAAQTLGQGARVGQVAQCQLGGEQRNLEGRNRDAELTRSRPRERVGHRVVCVVCVAEAGAGAGAK